MTTGKIPLNVLVAGGVLFILLAVGTRFAGAQSSGSHVRQTRPVLCTGTLPDGRAWSFHWQPDLLDLAVGTATWESTSPGIPPATPVRVDDIHGQLTIGHAGPGATLCPIPASNPKIETFTWDYYDDLNAVVFQWLDTCSPVSPSLLQQFACSN